MNRFNKNRNSSLIIVSGLCLVLSSCFVDHPEEPTPEPVSVQKDYLEIAAGHSHSLALIETQFSIGTTLLALGNNMHGQLGDSTTVNKDKPRYIGHGYTSISAGGSHSLALKHDTLFALLSFENKRNIVGKRKK